ncbi:hypothetical protein [Nonomuraea sp. NPDC003214]
MSETYTFIVDFYEPLDDLAQEVIVASGRDYDDARRAASRALGEAYAEELDMSADPLGERNGDGEAYVTAELHGDVAEQVVQVVIGECLPIRATG